MIHGGVSQQDQEIILTSETKRINAYNGAASVMENCGVTATMIEVAGEIMVPGTAEKKKFAFKERNNGRLYWDAESKWGGEPENLNKRKG